jgi:hypothetical protein
MNYAATKSESPLGGKMAALFIVNHLRVRRLIFVPVYDISASSKKGKGKHAVLPNGFEIEYDQQG